MTENEFYLLEKLLERRAILTYEAETDSWHINGQKKANKRVVRSSISKGFITKRIDQYIPTQAGHDAYRKAQEEHLIGGK